MKILMMSVRYGNGGFIMKYILRVIAVCLVLITAKLYIPEVNALALHDTARHVYYHLRTDEKIRDAVKEIIREETDEKFEDISEVFLLVGNSTKVMIVEQCRVNGTRISCPIDHSLTIQN